MCKDVKTIKAIEIKNKYESDVTNKVEELLIDNIKIDKIDVRKDWVERLELIDYNNSQIAFKIDIGAQCNVIPSRRSRNSMRRSRNK